MKRSFEKTAAVLALFAAFAAAGGHQDAAAAQDAIAERLTFTDIHEAQEIALNCVEQNFENCSR